MQISGLQKVLKAVAHSLFLQLPPLPPHLYHPSLLMPVRINSGSTFLKAVESVTTNTSGFKLHSPPPFLLAFVRVALAAAVLFFLVLSSTVLFRHALSAPGIQIYKNNLNTPYELVGQWYVQATNNWFTATTMNSMIDCEVGNSTVAGKIESIQCSWEWYNYYIYSYGHLHAELHQSSGNLFHAEINMQGFSHNHPIHVLEYEKDSHVILFSARSTFIPEGSLLVLTKQSIVQDGLHSHAQQLAQQHGINTCLYTLVPHVASGTTEFVYAVGDQVWKLVLLSLLFFVILSQLMPHDVTSLQSFSYSAIFSWNYGITSFHLTTVSFCSYHQSFFARFTHLTVLSDMIIWYPVVASWGNSYLITLFVLQTLQLLSYKDMKFATICFFTYLPFAFAGYYLMDYAYYCRILVIASAVAKVAGHSTESFPPPLSGDENFVSMAKLQFPAHLKIPFVVLFGIVSEMGTGMPTRNFTGAYYILLCKLGYQSNTLMPLSKLLEIDEAIQKQGWKGYPALQHAIESQRGFLQF